MDDLIWAGIFLIPPVILCGLIQYSHPQALILGLLGGFVWICGCAAFFLAERYSQERAEERSEW